MIGDMNNPTFLRGGGEMGALIRAKDWTKTPLGDPATWPQSLRTMVSVMLENPFGMYIAWGKEYTQLYNDAYRPILGTNKHPQALGFSTRDTFSEIWSIIGPMFEGVMQGIPVGFPDFMLPLNRNGYIEECYFDFSYSPIRLENGEVGGVLVTVTETTQQKKQKTNLQESEERFRTMAEGTDILIAIGDETSNAIYFNSAWVKLTGRPMEDLLEFGWVDLVHPDDRDHYVNIYLSAFEKRVPFTGEFRILDKNGQYRWLLAQGPPRFRTDGSFAGYISSCTDITERKQIEAESLRFKFIADHASDPFILMRKDASFAYLNKAAQKKWGYTEEEIKHIRVPDVDPIYHLELFNDAFAQAQKEPLPLFESLHKNKEGLIYPVEIKMRGLQIDGEEYMFAIARDITERKKAEEELQESKIQLEFAIEGTELAAIDFNPMSGKYSANPRFFNWFSLPEQEVLDVEQALDSIRDDDRERVREAFAYALTYDSGGNYDIEYTIKALPGQPERIVRAKGKTWFNENNEAVRFNCTVQDITKRYQAEQRIKLSESNLRLMIHQAPIAISILRGPEYVVEIANAKNLEILGRTEAEIVNQPIFESMPELLPQGIKELVDEVYTTGKRFATEELAVDMRRNGEMETVYINFSYEPLYDIDGKINGIMTIGFDVTPQVVARQKVEASEQKLNLIIEASGHGIWEVNLNTGETLISDRCFGMLGFPDKTPLSRDQMIKNIHPDDLFIREAAHVKAQESGYLHYEVRIIHPDQSIRWVEVKGKFFYENQGDWVPFGM
jgi:PAS domain S-box-containing protein